MTRYRTRVSREVLLLATRLDLPPGFRFVAVVGYPAAGRGYIVEVEDPDAPAELEGRLVELTFARMPKIDARPYVYSREVIEE